MVWRDIDFAVTAPRLTAAKAWTAMRPIVSHERMTRVTYSNETGHLNRSGRAADDRHYFVLHYETTEGREWKIDITFWVTDAPHNQRADALALARLGREPRLRILWLKDLWHRFPEYPYQVGGADIYDAVLEHGVRTPDEFDAYLIERGMPARDVQAP